MPTSHEIYICLPSQGHLCVINAVSYPVDKIEWYMYALFIRNWDFIKEQCLVDSHKFALSLDWYIWTISSLAYNRIQACCLEETHLEPIVPPLTFIYIDNGCKDYSTNTYIPSKTDLTTEIDTSLRCNFFVGFNVIYQNIIWYGIWNELKLETLTPEQKYLLGIKLSEFPLMTLNYLGKRNKEIGTSYPWSIPPVPY